MKTEGHHIPFQFNLGDVPLDGHQQGRLLDMMFDNQEISLSDEDLGFCDCITCFQPPQINQCTCCTELYNNSYKMKYANAWTNGDNGS